MDEGSTIAGLVDGSLGVVVQLARLTAVGVDRHPALGGRYLAARHRHHDATGLLLSDLVRAGPTPHSWRLDPGNVEDAATTRHVLLLLVAFDGWQRLRCCSRPGCTRPYIDASNALTRRYCVDHV